MIALGISLGAFLGLLRRFATPDSAKFSGVDIDRQGPFTPDVPSAGSLLLSWGSGDITRDSDVYSNAFGDNAITIPASVSGKYARVTATFTFAANATGFRTLRLNYPSRFGNGGVLDRTRTLVSGSEEAHLELSAVFGPLLTGDTFQVNASQGSGGNLAWNGARFQLEIVGE